MIISQLNVKKINKLINELDKELEEQIKNARSNNNGFNDDNMIFSGTPLYTHLRNYISENIFPAYGLAKHTKTASEIMFFCNYLCILLYSFIELYAQSLNVYYNLDLIPIRKAVNRNVLTAQNIGIVEQTKKGLSKISGKAVSIENVISELEGKYQTNEYFEEIKRILKCIEIKRLKDLRNNQLHYQSIFGRYNQSYMPGPEALFIFDIKPNNINIDEDEYSEFLQLSEDIIQKEIKLIFYFYEMILDQKMIKKDEAEEELCIVKCKECGEELMIPEEIISLLEKFELFPVIPHGNVCKGEIDLDIIRKINVHPEHYNSKLFYLITIVKDLIEKKK